MKSRIGCVCVLLLSSVTVFAAKPDPRLATVRKAWIQPVDELGDDKPVAACLAQHLATTTPLTVVESKQDAEVILLVSAHLPGNTSRLMFGGLGSVVMTAQHADGTVMWKEAETLQSNESLARQKSLDIPCALADGIADKLRQGMRKARAK